jgi:hypothetical protein
MSFVNLEAPRHYAEIHCLGFSSFCGGIPLAGDHNFLHWLCDVRKPNHAFLHVALIAH